MSFGLGMLAGIGRGYRSANEREAEAAYASEKQKNDATASMLHDFMLRDDVTPDVKQAALTSLMQFSQTKGTPTAKHRQSALDSILPAFNAPRPYTSPATATTQQNGRATAATGNALLDAGLLDETFGRDVVRRGEEAAASGETRSGFLQPDEMAQMRGRAVGVQTRAMYDALGSLPGMTGMNSSASGVGGFGFGGNAPAMMLVPDGKGGVKPHIVNPRFTPVQGHYIDSSGKEQTGWINYDHTHPMNATDGEGKPVRPLGVMTRDGWMTVTGMDAAGAPTKEVGLKSDLAERGPIEQFVRKSPVRAETVTGEQTLAPFDPVTGRAGTPQIVGQKMNSDINRDKAAAAAHIMKEKFKIEYDPTAFDGTVPAGQPIVNAEGGPMMVGTKQYRATIEPGSVLQRASAARTIMVHGEDTARMVEDTKNADLFGKVKGRWNELLVEGPQMFAAKWIGPIGTDDTRLGEVHAALKSISDLLTTVHGRRAEESARNFEHSLSLVNSPAALAATIRTYTKVAHDVAAEGNRPTTAISGVPRRSPTAPAPAAPTHRYVPGRGIVPITPAPATSGH